MFNSVTKMFNSVTNNMNDSFDISCCDFKLDNISEDRFGKAKSEMS